MKTICRIGYFAMTTYLLVIQSSYKSRIDAGRCDIVYSRQFQRNLSRLMRLNVCLFVIFVCNIMSVYMSPEVSINWFIKLWYTFTDAQKLQIHHFFFCKTTAFHLCLPSCNSRRDAIITAAMFNGRWGAIGY